MINPTNKLIFELEYIYVNSAMSSLASSIKLIARKDKHSSYGHIISTDFGESSWVPPIERITE